MPRKAFNSLTSREKWDKWKSLKGKWYCPHCHRQTDKPRCASPFHGASICCGHCDFEFTRRTGGGQCDPFNWHYGKPVTSGETTRRVLDKLERGQPIKDEELGISVAILDRLIQQLKDLGPRYELTVRDLRRRCDTLEGFRRRKLRGEL